VREGGKVLMGRCWGLVTGWFGDVFLGHEIALIGHPALLLLSRIIVMYDDSRRMHLPSVWLRWNQCFNSQANPSSARTGGK
jgi:hypothetical protein